MRQSSAGHIIGSRLLILQSKRLLLSSVERRAAQRGQEHLRERVERLRHEMEDAGHAYRDTVLKIASPEHPDYWPVAYSQLINLGNRLSDRLTRATEGVSPAERERIWADIDVLHQLVDGWTKAMRARIAAA